MMNEGKFSKEIMAIFLTLKFRKLEIEKFDGTINSIGPLCMFQDFIRFYYMHKAVAYRAFPLTLLMMQKNGMIYELYLVYRILCILGCLYTHMSLGSTRV